jgi:hypothetical protein
MKESDDIFGEALAELYVRLRDEFLPDYRGMDPADPQRAPIAMAILEHSAGGLTDIDQIETAVRSRVTNVGLPSPVIGKAFTAWRRLGLLAPKVVIQ